MSDQVRIGTCAGPADAAMVRAAFAAHGIHAFVGGEQTANVLGGLGGSFLSLDIWVAEEDAEEAAALLAELRGGTPPELDEGEDEAPPEDDEDADEGDALEVRVDRRKRTAIALLLGVAVPLGAAHLYTRAWLRGVVIAILQLTWLFELARPHPGAAAVLFLATIALDLTGAVLRIRASAPRALPEARVHRRRGA